MNCAQAEAALDSVVKNDFSSAQFVLIRNWTDGQFYIPDDSLRRYYYPETYDSLMGDWYHWTPTVWFDGVDDQTGVPFVEDPEEAIDSIRTLYGQKIQARLAVPSPLAMSLEVDFGAKGDSGAAHVEVIATGALAFEDLHLRLALIESDIVSGPKTYHQVLRDYLPDTDGISFAIALGDTFAHSQVFVVDNTWAAENCHIVAFVQDETTRQVVQAVQARVVTPAPQMVQNLTVTLSGNNLLLRWSPVTADTNGDPLEVDNYQVYRDTAPSFGPSSVPLAATADTFYLDASGVVGAPGVKYFYSVTAVAGGKESDFSAMVGEFNRQLIH